MQALLELDCFPAGMESFVASNDAQWKMIQGIIDECDYYVIIVAGRYGSTTSEGLSYTEKEFRYAQDSGIPILAFVHGDVDSLPSKRVDLDAELRAKLTEFRRTVMTGRTVREWTSAAELGALVSRSLVREMKVNPRVGWIRGSSLDPSQLVAENAELREALKIATAAQKRSEDSGVDVEKLRQDLNRPRVVTFDSPGEQKVDAQITIKDALINLPVIGRLDADEIQEAIEYAVAELMNMSSSQVDCYSGFQDELILTLQEHKAIEVYARPGNSSIKAGPNWLIAHRVARDME